MVREFSEEKKQEIFRLLDEIDMKDWKSFMEWCGSRAEEFGDWPDKLNVNAYTRYVDEYHKRVLEINEMTRQQVNAVFENVAEIDARYAARMRAHREKVKEQIAIVKTMTEFMDSMANGNPNMALLNVPTVNKNSVKMEEKKKENKEVNPPNHGREEQPLEVIVLDIPTVENQEISIINEAETQGIISESEVVFMNQLIEFIEGRSDYLSHANGLSDLYNSGFLSEENYNCLKDIIEQVNGAGDYDIIDLRELAQGVYTEIEQVITERSTQEIFYNSEAASHVRNDWLKLYTSQTFCQSGYIPRTVDIEDSNNRTSWYSYESCYSADKSYINPNGYMQMIDRNEKITAIILDNNIIINEDGRYWIAVGPNLINKDYPLDGKVQAGEFVYGTYIDIIVSDSSTGETYYIPCVVGDIKNHTYPNGQFHTGIPYPNSGDISRAKQDYSYVEFIGAEDMEKNIFVGLNLTFEGAIVYEKE